jgi:hypothetical protein
MRVDQVEVEAVAHERADRRQGPARKRMRGDVHADLRRQEITGMMHIDAVSLLETRRGGKATVLSPTLAREWKPRHRRHDLRLHFPTLQQFAQTRLDENAVDRPRGTGVERGEQEGFYHCARTCVSDEETPAFGSDSSFRRKPESRKSNELDPGLRRDDGCRGDLLLNRFRKPRMLESSSFRRRPESR